MGDVRTEQEQLRKVVVREPPDQGMTDRRRRFLATGLALLAISVALFLVWQTASNLLIIFAGVLFAAFLDAAARALALLIPLNRVSRLTLVLLLFTTMVGLGLVWGGGKLPEQTRILLKVMDTQFDVLQQRLLTCGVDLLGPEWGRDFAQWLLSDQGRFFSHAQLGLGRASSFLTGVLVIAFLGILFAFDPTSHCESLVMLTKPSYRVRTRAVMNEMGNVPRLWFVGQLIRIILMTLCVWVALYLIGLPGPFGARPISDDQKFQFNVQTLGRLATVDQFANIVLRADPDGSTLLVKDVARLEIGAQNLDSEARIDGRAAVPLAIYLAPGANAVTTAQAVAATMQRLSKQFLTELSYLVQYDSTIFVRDTISEVLRRSCGHWERPSHWS